MLCCCTKFWNYGKVSEINSRLGNTSQRLGVSGRPSSSKYDPALCFVSIERELTPISQMTHCYAQSYPEILNPDVKVFSDPSSAPTSTISSPWARWKITETARRTIFFANIVNYYINHNSTTKQQLPYYEPLDNELILNMPLPCSHAAWVAQDEQEWMNAIQTPPSPLALLGQDTLPGVSLKIILSKYTKDYVQRELGGTIGFGNSDQLRSLVILCASEQFT